MEVNQEVLSILKSIGAIREGHFIGTQGLHLNGYIDKDKLLPHTEAVSRICYLTAEQFKSESIDVVLGPALGGIVLSQWVAYHLSQLKGREVLSVYTEKTPGNDQMFTRGYDKLVRGRNVLIVEDTTTVGSSIKKVVRTVSDAEAVIVAVSIIVNRDPAKVNSDTMGVPIFALAEYRCESFEEKDVPEWLKKIPINTEVGHGKKYLESKKHDNQIRRQGTKD